MRCFRTYAQCIFVRLLNLLSCVFTITKSRPTGKGIWLGRNVEEVMPKDKKLTQFLKKHGRQQHLSATEAARSLVKRIQRKQREEKICPARTIRGKGRTGTK